MRRLAGLITVLVLTGLAGAAALGPGAQGSSDYRFDVLFDDARGLIPGQLVKIAGARAGVIDAVSITPDFKARISASIDARFRPFHANATCTIRPEGLIAENYVDCDPGNADSPALAASGGRPPTVPVNRTTEPVSLLNLFNIFNLPTRQRLMVIVDELGIGLAGEGHTLNDVIRRANPSLALANRVIGILARQRADLSGLVSATDTVARDLAAHPRDLQGFLDRGAALASSIAAHRDALSLAIARLPASLVAARPALDRLDAVARAGTPLIAQLGQAAPALDRAARDLGPFARTAGTGLIKLDGALASTIPALRRTTPVVKVLNHYLRASLPSTTLIGRLFPNLQRSGFAENLLSVFYYTVAATARYDSFGHILPAYLISPQNGACGTFANSPIPACSANYGPPAGARHIRATAPSRAAAPRHAGGHGVHSLRGHRSTASTAPGPAEPGPAGQLQQLLGGEIQQGATALQSLTDYLLR